MIGREGDCCWSHQRGKERSVEADERWRRRLEERPVQVLVFEDGTKPSRVDASWASPSVKLVIWFGGYRDLHRVVPREGWAGARYEFDHDKLGGVTTGRFRVNIAYRNSEFEKPVLREYKGVPAALGHITDPTIGSGRRCTRVTPESPIRENSGYGFFSDEKLGAAFDTIRGFLLRYWKRKVVRDFDAWWEDQRKQDEKIGAFPDPRSFEAGKAAISHANAASWWDWDGGSALFFWRLPKKFQIEMRDGLPPRFVGQPPRSKERQRRHKDPEVKWKE
jgi:hypothetical protein